MTRIKHDIASNVQALVKTILTMTAHDGGNGLDAKEYARVRATVCVSAWTDGDMAAWLAMCALYTITHFSIAAIRAYTDADVHLVAVVYPLYLFVIAYMSQGLFAKYMTRDNRFYTRVMFGWCMLFVVNHVIVVVVYARFDPIIFLFVAIVFSIPIDSFHDAQKEAKWKAHVVAHANPACHFHADCLCACAACTTPVDGPRHAGCEKHGVDVRAYLADVDLGTPDPWVACYIGAAAIVSLLFGSLMPHLLYLVHPSGASPWFWVHLALAAFSQMFACMLILIDSRVRAEFMRHLHYGVFVLCIFVWDTAVAGIAYWIATKAPETRWLAPVLHVLGFAVVCAATLAMHFLCVEKAKNAYVRVHIRPECAAHPQCLCTCDHCGPWTASAPAGRRSTRRAANSKK